MISVYVAGRSLHFPIPELLITILLNHGFSVTHDWTTEVRDDFDQVRDPKYRLSETRKEEIAILDVKAVSQADALVVVYHDGLGGGKLVELGVALGLKIPVFLFIPYQQKDLGNQVFYFHPGVEAHCYELNDLIAKLSRVEPRS